MLASDLADLRGELESTAHLGIDLVHWDIMDGHFVPNLTFGPPVIQWARKYSSCDFDVHLMVEHPEDFVEPLAACKVWQLCFQIEATRFAPRLCRHIRSQGMRPSIALNPQTPLSTLDHVLELADNVLVMTVDPGFGGQSFIDACWAKLERLNEIRTRRQLGFTLQVDGGVTAENLQNLAAYGVDIAVAGTAFFGAADRAALLQRAASL
jgi:ribulose-phosphate 3-epimerase